MDNVFTIGYFFFIEDEKDPLHYMQFFFALASLEQLGEALTIEKRFRLRDYDPRTGMAATDFESIIFGIPATALTIWPGDNSEWLKDRPRSYPAIKLDAQAWMDKFKEYMARKNFWTPTEEPDKVSETTNGGVTVSTGDLVK